MTTTDREHDDQIGGKSKRDEVLVRWRGVVGLGSSCHLVLSALGLH